MHYWRIQDENQIWNKSELFPSLDLVDAADRKRSMAILNDAFMSNDIILVEDGALQDGEELTNEPGAVVHLKQNGMGKVARLGGIQTLSSAGVSLDWFKGMIERTNRNYDTNMGQEATHIDTATGMAMLRQDAQTQASIKTADRNAGFERLYELLDWLALEFFDDDRMLFIGADEAREKPAERMEFNADDFSQEMPEVLDLDGNVVREAWTYWPRVDVTITASDSLVRGKKATMDMLQGLAGTEVTAANWKLLAAVVDMMDIPGKQDIIDEWERQFSQPMMPQQMPQGGGPVGDMGGAQGIEGAQYLPMLGGVPT